MKVTSLEQKRQIQALMKQDKTSKQIAEQLSMKVRTVRKWVQHLKKGAPYIALWADRLRGNCVVTPSKYGN